MEIWIAQNLRWTATVMLFLGTACGTVGLGPSLSETGISDQDTNPPLPLRIDDLSPSWGPLSGGTEVAVLGAGFEGNVQFWFGGSDVSVTLIDDENLVVYTPEVPVEAFVDVRIESDMGSFTLDDGFQFTNTQPDDDDDDGDDDGDGDDDDDGNTSATGLTMGMVEFDYIVVGCPSCFGFLDNLAVDATAIFHDGVSGRWGDWIPANGTCVLDPNRDGPTTNTQDMGEHVYLQSGTSSSVDLQRTNQGGSTTYASNGLAQDDYVKNASYDLVLPDSGSTVDDLLYTTSGLDSLTPTDILNDTTGAFPNFSASNAVFTWSPSGVADSYIVNIQVFNASGSAVLGDVVCAGDDSGSLLVPSSMLAGFPPGSLLAIYFYRWNTNEKVDPVTGHTIQGMSAFGGLGTGTLRP